MKAIETRYNGYRFRSRTEARWAVFLDKAGISYNYEQEGYEFEDGTRYLPDFYLKESKCFFEVKGTEPTFDEFKKAELLAEGSGCFVLLAIGAPELGERQFYFLTPTPYIPWYSRGMKSFRFVFGDATGHAIKLELRANGNGNLFFAYTDKDGFHSTIAHRGNIHFAFSAAREARFEFEEELKPIEPLQIPSHKPSKVAFTKVAFTDEDD